MLGFMLLPLLLASMAFPFVVSGDANATSQSTVSVTVVPKKVELNDGGVQALSLESSQLELEEDGKPVAFEVAKRADQEPFLWIILLDASNSQRGTFEGQRRAAIFAINTLVRDADKVVVVAFDTNVQTSGNGGSKRDAIALLDHVQPGGGTAFYDALHAASTYPAHFHTAPGSAAMLIFSDGDDNLSSIKFERVLAELEAADIACFPFDRNAALDRGLVVLRELADQTGGRMLAFRNEREARKVLTVWDSVLRQRMLLTYPVAMPPSAEAKRTPKKHALKLRSSRSDLVFFYRKHRIE